MASIFFRFRSYRFAAISSSNLRAIFASDSSRSVRAFRSSLNCSFNFFVVMISLRTLSTSLCVALFFSFSLSTFFLKTSKRLRLISPPSLLHLETCEEALLVTDLESSVVFFLMRRRDIVSLAIAISFSRMKLCFSKTYIFFK